MRITSVVLMVDGDMSGNLTSNVQQINQQFGYAIQATYSTAGTLAGTLSLECSVDRVEDNYGNVLNQGTWVQIADSSKVISESDSPLSYVWNVTAVYYPFVRVVYVADPSDTGQLNISYFGRGF